MRTVFESLKSRLRELAPVGVLILVLLLLTGWGSTGHKIINRSGTVELPPEMLGFIQRASMLADSASNADNRKSMDPNESPKHFIDIDDYPEFASRSVPHSLDSLIQKYGASRVTTDGILPWATVTAVDSLIAQMQRGELMNHKRPAHITLGGIRMYPLELTSMCCLVASSAKQRNS